MCKNGNGNGNGRLTGKQQAFVNAYCGEANFNATRAAELAGYEGDYWTLAQVGSKNLKTPKIAERVSEYFAAFAMTSGEVLMRLGEIARGEWAQYVDNEGNVDFARLKADDKIHLVSEIRDTRNGKSVKFCDMQGALVQIGKHHRLFVDRHEHTGADGGAITLRYGGNVNPDDV